MLLEVCAYSLASCEMAAKAGAHRVELCADRSVGGTTAAKDVIIAALELGIPVFPMVRPRGGDFLYSKAEWDEITETVWFCRDLACTGIVTGVQLPDGRLDGDHLRRLVDLASPMEVTCHKVFDGVPDAMEALETLVEAGCTRVLTSGLAPDAMQGAATIHQLVKQADGRIRILVGGGVRSTNIGELMRYTGANEFHSSAITAGSVGDNADEQELHALVKQVRRGR